MHTLKQHCVPENEVDNNLCCIYRWRKDKENAHDMMDSGFLRCSKCSPVQHFHTKCYTLFLLVMLNFNLKRLFKVRFHIYHCSGSPHQTYSGAFAISIFETDHESVSDLYNTHYLKWQMTGLGDNPCGEMGCQIQCQMECGPFFFAARKKKIH